MPDYSQQTGTPEAPDYSVFQPGHPLTQQLGMALTTLSDILRSPQERESLRAQRLAEIKAKNEATYQQGELGVSRQNAATNQAQQAESARHNAADESNAAANTQSEADYRTSQTANDTTKILDDESQMLDVAPLLKALGQPDEVVAAAAGKKVKSSELDSLLKKPAEKTPQVETILNSGKPHRIMYDEKGNVIKDLGETTSSASSANNTPLSDEDLQQQVEALQQGRTAPSLLVKGFGGGLVYRQITDAFENQIDPNTGEKGNLQRAEAGYKYGSNTTVQGQMVTSQHLLEMADVMDGIYDQLSRGNARGINWASNAMKKAFGNETITNAETANTFFSGEAIKYVTNNGGGEKERTAAEALANPNASPSQTKGALNTIRTFVNSRYNLQKQSAGGTKGAIGGGASGTGGPDPNQPAALPKQMRDKNGKIYNLQSDGTYK